MELRHLRYFTAVAELENVSKAALRLHVSQPALSRQVRDLEDELGFALLERSAKSVRLTKAGGVFLVQARAVLEHADEAVRRAREVATGETGELFVGYAPVPTARFLSPTLRLFQEEHPGVRVKLKDLSTEEMLTGIRKGALGLAFLVKPTKKMLRGLRFETLAHDEMRLAVPRGHPFAKLRRVPMKRLIDEPLVAYSRKDYPEYHESLEHLFATVGGKPRIAEEHEGGTGMVAAVEAGYGLALTLQSLACSVGKRIHLLALDPQPEPLEVGAVYSPRSLSAVAEHFLKCSRSAAKTGTGGQGTS